MAKQPKLGSKKEEINYSSKQNGQRASIVGGHKKEGILGDAM